MIYLTRDTLPDGTLASWIDAWSIEPERHTTYHPNGAVWTGPKMSLRGYIWALDEMECFLRYGAVAESDEHYVAIGPSGKELS